MAPGRPGWRCCGVAISEARRTATPQNNRFHRVFEELADAGIHAEPAVYADDIAEEVREQLLSGRWRAGLGRSDPSRARRATVLDALLRDVASRGPWVSAHPDVILKMGVKEVLHRTKHLGWGTDTHLYRTAAEFRAAFPSRLRSAGPRVLKQNRGNGGQGVWKVELIAVPAGEAEHVRVLHAQRGSVPEEMPLAEFMARCEPYFASDGCIVDQPFQPRLPDGMIRCYMGADKVVGFGHQFIKALIPPPPEGPDSPAAQPGPRIMHGADAPPFQALRDEDGNRVDAADDGGARHRRRVAADHLGCRFPLRTAHRVGRGQLRAVRDQRQFGVRDSRPGAGSHRAADHGPAAECRRGVRPASCRDSLLRGRDPHAIRQIRPQLRLQFLPPVGERQRAAQCHRRRSPPSPA